MTIDMDLHQSAALGRGVTTRRAATVLAATAGALLIWVVADPIAGLDLSVGSGSTARAVGPGAVVGVSVLAGLAAVGLAVLLTRLTSRARRVWQAVAVATLALSLAGPLGAATAGAGLALAAMHLVVGTTLIVGIGSTVGAARRMAP